LFLGHKYSNQDSGREWPREIGRPGKPGDNKNINNVRIRNRGTQYSTSRKDQGREPLLKGRQIIKKRLGKESRPPKGIRQGRLNVG